MTPLTPTALPPGWFSPDVRPAHGQVCDLLTRDGRVHPALTYRDPLGWFIRDFSPWNGYEVGWRPAEPKES